MRAGRLHYELSYHGHPVITPSPLGMMWNEKDLGFQVRLGESTVNLVDTTYQSQNKGEVHEQYRETRIPVLHRRSGTRYYVHLRTYNEGISYRFELIDEHPAKDSMLVHGESSEWNLPPGTQVWYAPLDKKKTTWLRTASLDTLDRGSIMSLPLTVSLPDSAGYAWIGEIEDGAYGKMTLKVKDRHSLQSFFPYDEEGWNGREALKTPWRVIMLGKTLNELVNHDLVYYLSESPPNFFRQTDWIQPGRMLRFQWYGDSIPLRAARDFIHRASQIGVEYVLLDGNWLHHEDPFTELGILTRFGKVNDTKLWVWLHGDEVRDTLRRQSLFRKLTRADIAGVQIDYLPLPSFANSKSLYEQIRRDAARFRLMLSMNIPAYHTQYRRKWPHVMSENMAIPVLYQRSSENISPPYEHNLALPFTQMLAGPILWDCCDFEKSLQQRYTWTHQLAQAVVYNHRLLMLAGKDHAYDFHPTLPVIRDIPFDWDETLILPGSEIGKLAALARRKGKEWYVAVLNGLEARQIDLDLGFLGEGNYLLSEFADNSGEQTQVLHSESIVNAKRIKSLRLNSGGGWVGRLKPSEANEQYIEILYEDNQLTRPMKVRIEGGGKARNLHYTLDGSDVSENSPRYRKSLTIFRPLHLKVASFDGKKKMNAFSEAYFISFQGPTFQTTDTLFWEEIDIELKSSIESNAPIRYTLDGTIPNRKSTLYRNKPITLRQSALVTAAVFLPSGVQSLSTQSYFARSVPIKASKFKEEDLKKGLYYRYYKKQELSLHDADSVKPNWEAAQRELGATPLKRMDSVFTLIVDTYFNVPEDGLYTLDLQVGGEATMFIGQREVLRVDSENAAMESATMVGLKSGFHNLKIVYHRRAGAPRLKLAWGNTNQLREDLRNDEFFYFPGTN